MTINNSVTPCVNSIRSEMPPTLPGFEQINRYWDVTNSIFVAKIQPGEYYVTTNGEMITTVLGSCISACIRCAETKIGGMNHFMLPEEVSGAKDAWKVTSVNAGTRYGTFAMEHLINTILRFGGNKNALEVKLFGGGRVMQLQLDVAERNVEFIKRFVDQENLHVLSSDLGGTYPRKVIYFPQSGKVRMKKLTVTANDTLIKREQSYRNELVQKPQETEIELF